jgi:hypothetical protein
VKITIQTINSAGATYVIISLFNDKNLIIKNKIIYGKTEEEVITDLENPESEAAITVTGWLEEAEGKKNYETN